MANFTVTSAYRSKPLSSVEKPTLSLCVWTLCLVLNGDHICVSKRNPSWKEFDHPLSQSFPPLCRPFFQKRKKKKSHLWLSLLTKGSSGLSEADWLTRRWDRAGVWLEISFQQYRLRILKLIPSELFSLSKESPFFCSVGPRLLTWLKNRDLRGRLKPEGGQPELQGTLPGPGLRVACRRPSAHRRVRRREKGGEQPAMASVKNTVRVARSLSWWAAEQGGPVAFTAGSGDILWPGAGWPWEHSSSYPGSIQEGAWDLWHYELPSGTGQWGLEQKSPHLPHSVQLPLEYLAVFPLPSVLIVEATPGLNWLACRNAILYIPIHRCSRHLSLTLFIPPLTS